MLLSVAKLVLNLEINKKIAIIFLNQGARGIESFTEVLDISSDEQKRTWLTSILQSPLVLKNVVIPIFLQDMKSKLIPATRRNQASAALSRLGLLLEDELVLSVLSSLVQERGTPEYLLLISCLL
jgi:hypothetical protein